jgi:hypothetical protein
MIVTGVQNVGHRHLFDVAQAHALLRFAFGSSQCRQQQSRQNGNDGNYHEQLNQREPPAPASFGTTAGRGKAGNSRQEHFHNSTLLSLGISGFPGIHRLLSMACQRCLSLQDAPFGGKTRQCQLKYGRFSAMNNTKSLHLHGDVVFYAALALSDVLLRGLVEKKLCRWLSLQPFDLRRQARHCHHFAVGPGFPGSGAGGFMVLQLGRHTTDETGRCNDGLPSHGLEWRVQFSNADHFLPRSGKPALAGLRVK